MSRTDKDRPYWVIQNDRTLGTVEHHDHRKLGKVVRIIDNPGTLVERRTGEFYPRLIKVIPTHANGYASFRIERIERVVREWVGRTYKEVRLSDECDASLPYPVRRDREAWFNRHCTTEVPLGRRKYRYTDAPSKEDRREGYHAPMRRRERDSMRRFVAEYNTFGEVDDSTWQNFQHRGAPIGGGYWD